MTLDRFIGTLIGCAIGDTLGMAVEGWKPEQIKKYVRKITEPIEPVVVKNSEGEVLEKDEHGRLKLYAKGLSKGEYTDDTILTVAIAKSIVEKKGLDLNDLAKKHVEEYEACILKDGTMKGGFGKTTQMGIKKLKLGFPPEYSGEIGGPGNAPGMKMHPIGMYIAATGEYEKGLEFAEKISKLTHLDPRSIASGVVQADAIYSALKNKTKEEIIDRAVKVCKENEKELTREYNVTKGGTLLTKLDWVKENMDATAEEAHDQLKSSSLVYQSYPFALFMFQKYFDDPVNGLIETVNYGGDCDTTGAIFGALAGARHGNLFPSKWLTTLQNRELLETLGSKIYRLRGD